jgi:hypothetical protein
MPTANSFRAVGRQSAILAKTLLTNRFLRPSKTGRTQGIRLGGCGFQKIKKSFRRTAGFELFSVSARPACATHNFPAGSAPAFQAGRLTERLCLALILPPAAVSGKPTPSTAESSGLLPQRRCASVKSRLPLGATAETKNRRHCRSRARSDDLLCQSILD